MPSSRAPAIFGLLASCLGLSFAGYSTLDYASHLDRRLHDVHCSFIPGAPPTADAEACRAAMYSPYSALLKDAYWGGIPISLFGLGAFAFFLGFSLYLLFAGSGAPRKALGFYGVLGLTPLIVSLLMLAISVTKLGQVCSTCAGIYGSSALLSLGAAGAMLQLGRSDPDAPRPGASWALPTAWLLALGLTTLVPAVVYAASVPDHRPFLTQCGELKLKKPATGDLVTMRGARPIQEVTFFEDPLCPTCKAFHQRLVTEGVFDRLDARLVLFPLDNECNWMLDSPLHPGACLVSKAILCAGDQARNVLEWAYEEQEYLSRAGKSGKSVLSAAITQRWGPAMGRCISARETEVRLNNHLHFATENQVPISTPQMYLGKRRVCDEDTDIGLRFTLQQLAPEVVR